MEQAYDFLVIGGGVAGVTAAETIRGELAEASIAIISVESESLYSRVLLPRYVRGELPRDGVFLRDDERYRALRIDRITGEAVALDSMRRAVSLADGRAIHFRKLLLAGGGTPKSLSIPGENLLGVSRFQTLADADRMRELLHAGPRRALVIGSGFIALEYLSILKSRGIETSLLTGSGGIFGTSLDQRGQDFFSVKLAEFGITLLPAGAPVTAMVGDQRVSGVLVCGEQHPFDFVGIGIGIRRNVSWLSSSGLTGVRGILVDEFLETRIPGISAAGDIAERRDHTTGQYISRGTWTNAFQQGRLAGKNLATPSGREPDRHLSAYTVRSLGLTIALLGSTQLGLGVASFSRGGADAGRYQRFFVCGGRLHGAILVNTPEDQAAASLLIQRGVLLPEGGARLSRESFDLRQFIGNTPLSSSGAV